MENVVEILGLIKTQLDRSELAYKAYLSNGKIFLYAKIIKEANDALSDLLFSYTHLLPVEQTKNALALIHHIDVWRVIWVDAFTVNRPSLISVFEFENRVNFPRKEVAKLMEYFEKISTESPRLKCK